MNPDNILDLNKSQFEIDQALPTPGKDEIDLSSELFDRQI